MNMFLFLQENKQKVVVQIFVLLTPNYLSNAKKTICYTYICKKNKIILIYAPSKH